MTGPLEDRVDVDQLGDDELAAALLAGIVGSDWSERAAVELVVAQRTWLGRAEFRQAVVGAVRVDGELCAWVKWAAVAVDAPASSGELRVLVIARSLGGIASERSLADLLVSLDEANTAHVLRAMALTCRGWGTPPHRTCDCGEEVAGW